MPKKVYVKIGKSKEEWTCEDCKNKTNKILQSTKQYTIADVMDKLNDMDNKYQTLFEKYNQQVKINKELKDDLKRIQIQLNTMEQKEINNNVMLYGIPYKKNENVREIVKNVGNHIQVPVNEEEFTAIRVGRNDQGDNTKNNPIRVIFRNAELKKGLMKSPKKISLNAENLGLGGSSKIFINHELTKKNLQTYKAALNFRKENAYKYLWVAHGKIMLRKSDNSKILLIEEEEDLKN